MSDPLRASAITTQIVTLLGVAGLALLVRAPFHLSGWYPVKAAGAFAVVAVLAVRHVRAHHRFARFGPANQITTLRAAMVALVAGAIGEPMMPAVAESAVCVSLAAMSLDGVDGWAARRSRMVSPFGARFDVETDAALIQLLAILVWQYDKAGPWVLASGLLRYAFVAAGWMWPWMRRPLPATFRRKSMCIVQVAALIAALVPAIVRPASASIAAAGLLALCYSFLADAVWLWRSPSP